MRASILGLTVMLASCSHLQDQTVDEHRNEAEVHLAKAAAERAKVDPADTMRAAPRVPGTDQVGGVPFEAYRPSQSHLVAADRELAKANEHLAAAKSLEAFEDKACVGLSAGERASCPLFASSVRHVTWIKAGFKLTFSQPADVKQTYQRLSCHLAYAVATGFDKPSCPLFIKGTTLRREGTDSIEFAGDTEAVADALRAQARRIFLGAEGLASGN